jgi:hypothetical protein
MVYRSRFICLCAWTAMACAVMCMQTPTQVPAQEDGFTSLFNGKNLDGWFIRPEQPPPVWRADKEGNLLCQPSESMMWSKDAYGDFILELEFCVPHENSNSGVFFRANPDNRVQEGLEIQVFSSYGKQNPDKHDCGALYDAQAPALNAEKKQGEWNKLRLEAKGSKIEAFINDQTVLDLNLDDWTKPHQNPDGSRNKYAKALKDFPRKGHIGLQDHTDSVRYRNIRIKPLN